MVRLQYYITGIARRYLFYERDLPVRGIVVQAALLQGMPLPQTICLWQNHITPGGVHAGYTYSDSDSTRLFFVLHPP